MRRIVIPAGLILPFVLIGLGSTGCSNFRDLFSAHADVAAEAGGQELPAKRLADIVGRAGKGVKVNRETAAFIANVWTDYALFGQAVAQNRLPLDSTSIAEAVWPEISELKGTRWHDTLMAHRGTLPDSSIDSLYRTPTIRLIQHILISAKTNEPAAVRDSARRKAVATLAKIRGGAPFGKLAVERSEDKGSAVDSGYLPPGPRGRFVPTFDSVAWSLEPAQVSGVVESPFGYHIIRRPPVAEVRGRLEHYLQEQAGVRLDASYMDSLATANEVEVVSGAPSAMRGASESPDESRHSTKELVRFRGGALTVRDYLRWSAALPPQYSARLKTSNDSDLVRFARVLAQNVLLLREADSAKIALSADEWSSLRQQYIAQLDTLKGEMGLSGSDLTDSTVALAEREKVAAMRVEAYFDQVIAGKGRLRPLPSALATLLRDRLPHRIYDAGVTRAVELATADKEKADSTEPKSGMQRAPGGPPIPGGAAPDSTGAAAPEAGVPPAAAPPASTPKKQGG